MLIPLKREDCAILIEATVDPKVGKDRVDLNITFINDYGVPEGKPVALSYALDDFIDEEKTIETLNAAIDIAIDMNEKSKELNLKKLKVKEILSNIEM